MSSNHIDPYEDIQKIQSFIITITSPFRQMHQQSSNEISKKQTQNILEDLEEKEPLETHKNVFLTKGEKGRTETVDLALRKIDYKTKLNQKVQRYTQVRERCELLIKFSPNKARHSSTGCLEKASPTQKSKLKILHYHKQNPTQNMFSKQQRRKIPLEQNIFVPLPQLKINPLKLTLKCNGQSQSFYLLKMIKEKEKYSLYLAQNQKSRAIFTLKIIKKYQLKKEQIENFIKQLKFQAFLSHVNLLKVVYITNDKHFLYVFYEPCMISNLSEQTKQGVLFEERQVRRIIKQICSVVDYLQRNSITHQNIRPQSVYLHEGIVKLGDLSKASHFSHQLISKSKSQGSFKLSTPQSLLVDSKIDVWDIGILTYELLFGRTPIELHSSLRHQSTEECLYFNDEIDVSNTAKSFILVCLEKNHVKRLGMKGIIQHVFLKGGEKYRWTTA